MIDLEMFGLSDANDDANSNGDPLHISLYRRFLLNKYPEMTQKNYRFLHKNLESLKKRSALSKNVY